MLHWIIAAISLWMAYLLREEFPPFIIGAVIAYLLAGPVNLLTKKAKLPRSLAVAIIYILALGGIGLAIYKGQPFIAEEAKSLFANRQEILENVVGQISSLTGWSPDISDVASQVLDKIQHFVTGKPEELLSFGGKISHGILTTLICLIVSVYMLYDGKSIGRFFLRFVPEDKREHCLQVAAEINTKFSRYIAGQMILVALMAVLAFILFCCFQVKYALLLAVLIGVLEIVPIIGPLFALTLAMIVTSSQLGLSTAMTVTAILWVIRIVEDYVVIPRVIGHAVQLHPLVTIFSVLAGETLAGGLGMLLAVPFAAAVKVVIDRLHPAIPVATPVPPAPDVG